jgi:hypothetical protein
MKHPLVLLLIGLVVGAAGMWFRQREAIAAAEYAVVHQREEAERAKALGTDDRLTGYHIQGISGGNGTVYLHNTETGAVWLVTPDGIKPVPAPPAP